MATSLRALAASALLAASIAGGIGAASAAPGFDHLAFKSASPSTVELAQWRGGWGWGWGAPVAGGFVAGALLNGNATPIVKIVNPSTRGPPLAANQIP